MSSQSIPPKSTSASSVKLSQKNPPKQSAERIRERFLHRIGIDSNPPQSAPDIQNKSCSISPSCLGEVVRFYEPLKVCLDDSSSIDDDDDDFYFGDEEDGEEMDFSLVVAECLSTASPSSPSSLTSHPTATICASQQAHHDPTPALSIISDEGSSQCSHSIASSQQSSIGNLSQYYQDGNAAKSESHEQHPHKKKKRRKVTLDNEVSVVPIPMRCEYSDRTKERLWSNATELYQNAARNSIEFASEGWDWRTVAEDEQMILCQVSGELIHPIHVHNLLFERELLNNAAHNNADKGTLGP
mmetsp:Transcript_6106/g.8813  ORF Transcript_6106/g.8813 Transcript_6106/m.8813 type:complete len:299 (+) Transcript_6106:280-1176(+)|eukprot:CAMPEP_0195521446 /NCGR_PEP_ID=MMETSP0794_2-20130614/18694_1 /TAXON_ID=515487 /ORGANISM="Stephanopyxis turris, Strain CCMP 815" /LENGTH=298 /DNA_ID=CAMNT_0040651005 /DNA_START=279 /DNA_END=1175 /DNA_ORIENTATION=+